MTAPAILSASARSGGIDLTGSRLRFLGSAAARNSFAVLAAGELIADKLPFIPNRTDPVPLVGRLVAGGLCGAAVAVAEGRSLGLGLALGGLGAAVGAFAGYHLRRRATRQGHVPDLEAALIEDTLAVLGGAAAVKAIHW